MKVLKVLALLAPLFFAATTAAADNEVSNIARCSAGSELGNLVSAHATETLNTFDNAAFCKWCQNIVRSTRKSCDFYGGLEAVESLFERSAGSCTSPFAGCSCPNTPSAVAVCDVYVD